MTSHRRVQAPQASRSGRQEATPKRARDKWGLPRLNQKINPLGESEGVYSRNRGILLVKRLSNELLCVEIKMKGSGYSLVSTASN
jgi:hypothetical protein